MPIIMIIILIVGLFILGGLNIYDTIYNIGIIEICLAIVCFTWLIIASIVYRQIPKSEIQCQVFTINECQIVDLGGGKLYNITKEDGRIIKEKEATFLYRPSIVCGIDFMTPEYKLK